MQKMQYFFYFIFFICMNCLQLLFVLIILAVWLIICLESRLLTLFVLLLLLQHLLVVVNHLILFPQLIFLYTIHYSSIHQVLNSQDHNWGLFCFFLHLINHYIHQNMFQISHYIILKLYHTHLFFVFSFCVFSLLNLFKSLKKFG